MDNNTSKQTEANKRWQEKTKYLHRRSIARTFIKEFATMDDIAELEKLIEERKKANDVIN